jgi:glycosyltransferase involved in cell wall biosynthesis
MRSVLFLSARLPFPLNTGGSLRIFNVARQLVIRGHSCHLAVLQEDPRVLDAMSSEAVFETVSVLPAPRRQPNVLRHLRLSDTHYHRITSPTDFHAVVTALNDIVAERRIGVAIATSQYVAEYARQLEVPIRIVDACDSLTLTMQRERNASEGRSFRQRLANGVSIVRMKRLEGHLAGAFDFVVAISEQDRAALASLSNRNRDRILVVPNGVSEGFMEQGAESTAAVEEAAIAFWGVLDYPPNETAVWQFYEKVYRPSLADRDIRWYIIGPNASAEIVHLGEKHPNIRVTGFVRDLAQMVASIPIMINPMTTGAGQKNKVLEAFVMRRAVISTALGMEGVPLAGDGEHYMLAEVGHAFADAITTFLDSPSLRVAYGERARDLVLRHYTWKAVGRQWDWLIRAGDQQSDSHGLGAVSHE